MSARLGSASAVVPSGQAFLVGVDGGGTSTRARIVARDGRRLGEGLAGPSALAQGIEDAWKNVRAAIDAAARDAGLEGLHDMDCAVGMGLAGFESDTLRERFLARAPRFACLRVFWDAEAALAGAHCGTAGSVAIVGTGAVGLACTREGQARTVGGWGFPSGDEGSGAWIGVAAVRAAQRVTDGRERRGPLADAVLGCIGQRREQLLDWCISAGQHDFARLAPWVFDAQAVDSVADAIITEATAHLEALILALDSEGSLPVVVLGGVGVRLAPGCSAPVLARRVEARGDAIDGALHLLCQAGGGLDISKAALGTAETSHAAGDRH